MKITGQVKFTYKTNKDANLVFDSLEVDNENYLESQLENNCRNYTINSEKLGTFLATADDLIASEIVVEKIVEKTKQWKVLYK